MTNTAAAPAFWVRAESFDTAAQCEEQLRAANAEASRTDSQITDLNKQYWTMVAHGECIASDDLRLKEK
jgi:hypothetical protein